MSVTAVATTAFTVYMVWKIVEPMVVITYNTGRLVAWVVRTVTPLGW